MIINENNLLEYIKNYAFIDSFSRSSIIKYFDKLNEKQILSLIKYFNEERKDVLFFLKSFKDKNICSFEQIKTELDSKTRIKIRLEERQEIESEQDDFSNLLNSIDNL
ncbi:MAG: hypothetical protein PHV23_01375 [Candidatus Gracilibacteria bacterium]|nr:hypothetical protein [Candidatus Gracilibacteria bacterium]